MAERERDRRQLGRLARAHPCFSQLRARGFKSKERTANSVEEIYLIIKRELEGEDHLNEWGMSRRIEEES